MVVGLYEFEEPTMTSTSVDVGTCGCRTMNGFGDSLVRTSDRFRLGDCVTTRVTGEGVRRSTDPSWFSNESGWTEGEVGRARRRITS